MLAILFHPTEELKLSKFTKKLIAENYSSNLILYRKFPLWIQLSEANFYEKKIELNQIKDAKIFLKTVTTSISKIIINSPVLYQDGIFCNVSITTGNAEITAELQLAEIYNKTDKKENLIHSKKNTRNIFQSELFPMELKIFRVGNLIELSENSLALKDSVWHKL